MNLPLLLAVAVLLLCLVGFGRLRHFERRERVAVRLIAAWSTGRETESVVDGAMIAAAYNAADLVHEMCDRTPEQILALTAPPPPKTFSEIANEAQLAENAAKE